MDAPSMEYIFCEGSEDTLSYSSLTEQYTVAGEEEPTATGNFWHYVDGVPTIWETKNRNRINRGFG